MKTARTVQDGHSVAEQAIYLALWAAGTADAHGNRIAALGYSEIASRTGLHRKSIGRIMRSLEAKLSIQVIRREDAATRTARTYLVFSYIEILRRREQAGLTRVNRNRFVDLESLANGIACGGAPVVQPATDEHQTGNGSVENGLRTPFSRAAANDSSKVSADWSAMPPAWITPEIVNAARTELARHRTLGRDGRERSLPPEFPDLEITMKILSCFSGWQSFAEFLRELLGRCSTSEIRGYGFYLATAQRRV